MKKNGMQQSRSVTITSTFLRIFLQLQLLLQTRSQSETAVIVPSSCLFGDCNDGAGIFRYKNGDVYIGEWAAKLRDGVGVYNFKKGEVYRQNI